jgi:sugar/nucleoside kinase (ribokinase family)
VIERQRDAKPHNHKTGDGDEEADPDDAAQQRRRQLGERAGEGGEHRHRLLADPEAAANRFRGWLRWPRPLPTSLASLYCAGFHFFEEMRLLMVAPTIDVAGIGNAIVDVITSADEALLASEGFAKGSMTLIDAVRADSLYARVGPAIESSGGSAGNTMAGIASLGGNGAYIGKVRDDILGRVFRHDITAIGIRFETPAATDGPGTARCIVMVTEDGHRTMGTYLGACVGLGPDDVDPAIVGAAQITYLEGYLFDPPSAKAAFRKAAAIAHGAGRQVSLSLSDSFCVGRYRNEFRELVTNDIDILFANEAEICSLYETDDFDAAVAAVRGHVSIAALTRSEHGSVLLAGTATHVIPAKSVRRVVDTTGAGDLYASGVLFGLTRGLPLPTCGALGSVCAAEIIGHVGARPEARLHQLAASAGLV